MNGKTVFFFILTHLLHASYWIVGTQDHAKQLKIILIVLTGLTFYIVARWLFENITIKYKKK